jgi:plasmid stabilization system protein ParE
VARVIWSPQARGDLSEIVGFIGRDSKTIARVVGERIKLSTRRLREFPASGRLVPEFNDETLREVIAQNYRVLDHYDGNDVGVLAVIHGGRDLRLERLPEHL